MSRALYTLNKYFLDENIIFFFSSPKNMENYIDDTSISIDK